MELIVAVDEKGGIGKEDRLLYHIPEDMRRFKELTMGKTLLMGRNTFFSLPGDHLLPGRTTCVLSRRAADLRQQFPSGNNGPFFYDSPQAFLSRHGDKNVIVIGGEAVYREMLPFCECAYVTEIHAEREADRFFRLDPNEWICAIRQKICTDSGIFMDFCTYERVNLPK